MEFVTAFMAMKGRGLPIRRSIWPEGACIRFFPTHRCNPPQEIIVLERGDRSNQWNPRQADLLATDWETAENLAMNSVSRLATVLNDPMFR